jgi:hypothetical protein
MRRRNFLPFASICIHSDFMVGSMLLILLGFFSVLLLCVFAFRVSCFDFRYDFHMKTMFGSSLLPVVCRRVRYLCLFAYSGVQHILCCGFLRIVYPGFSGLSLLYALTFIYTAYIEKLL